MKSDSPDSVPSPDKFRQLTATYTPAVHAAANGDAEKIQERKRVRAELELATGNANGIMLKTSHRKDLILQLSEGFEQNFGSVAGAADSHDPFSHSASRAAFRPTSREGTIEELNMKIEIFKGGNGQYYFHVKSANGEKIAQSEGYTKKQSAEDTIEAMKRELASATVVEIP